MKRDNREACKTLSFPSQRNNKHTDTDRAWALCLHSTALHKAKCTVASPASANHTPQKELHNMYHSRLQSAIARALRLPGLNRIPSLNRLFNVPAMFTNLTTRRVLCRRVGAINLVAGAVIVATTTAGARRCCWCARRRPRRRWPTAGCSTLWRATARPATRCGANNRFKTILGLPFPTWCLSRCLCSRGRRARRGSSRRRTSH